MSMRYQAGVLTASYSPLKTPDAPTVGTLSNAGSLSFTAPSNVGGGAITGYVAVATDSVSGATFSTAGSSSPISINGLTVGNTYTAKVFAINAFGNGPLSSASNSATIVPPVGQQNFTTAGTFSFVAPSGVTSVCVIAIGGGGAGYSSRQSSNGSGGYSSFQGGPYANGGGAASRNVGGSGGSVVSGSGYSGGSGDYAGGYTAGTGGGAGYNLGTAPGGQYHDDWVGDGGYGASLTGGYVSGGTGVQPYAGVGGTYGGGGGGGRDGGGGGGGACAYVNNIPVVPGNSYTVVVGAAGPYSSGAQDNYAAAGGGGAVRVIWGANRAYPSTNIGNL